jgi:hypothetical protein
MDDEQKIKWAIIAADALFIALLIPFLMWMGAVLP